jgi:hypothetical protein
VADATAGTVLQTCRLTFSSSWTIQGTPSATPCTADLTSIPKGHVLGLNFSSWSGSPTAVDISFIGFMPPNIATSLSGPSALPNGTTATTQAPGDASDKLATDAFVANTLKSVSSPAFTGTPTAPTAAAGTNSTQVATTAFVQSAIAANQGPIQGAGGTFSGDVSVKGKLNFIYPGSGASAGFVQPGWFTGGVGTWIDMPTNGPSGIGSGGPGSNAWIAYVDAATHWFLDGIPGDIAYRNTDGRILIGATNPSQVQISKAGVNVSAPFSVSGMIQETLHTPSSSSEACSAGQFVDDANFHYVCTSANHWKRVALADF